MPVLVAWLLEGLGALLLSATAKILFSLGVGFITYLGMDAVLAQLTGYVTSSYAGMPSAIAGFVGLLQLDRAVSIVLGAVSARFALLGVSGASGIRKLIWK